MRRSRVSGRLASAIHSTYSRRWLGANPSKVARAAAFPRSAAASSAGPAGSGRGARRGRAGAFTPSSLSRAAVRT
jgi:hypothetical protein